jgi:hypothetical protein
VGISRADVKPSLPPPDPNETPWSSPAGDFEVPAPTAIFAHGTASPEADRLADALLDLRPGLLLVVAQS